MRKWWYKHIRYRKLLLPKHPYLSEENEVIVTQPNGDFSSRNVAVQSMVPWFDFSHLQEGKPRTVSGMCHELMLEMLDEVRIDSPELTAGLRKLLEAKDCFVRAALFEIRS